MPIDPLFLMNIGGAICLCSDYSDSNHMAESEDVVREIVSYCRTNLCADLRFMTQAVLSLEFVIEDGDGQYSFDRRHIYLPRERVISDFKANPNIITRAIAHMIMHLVLDHSDTNTDPLRDLAEDMIVEYSLDMLDTPNISLPEDDDRIFIVERLIKKAGAPTVDLLSAVLSEVSEWQLNSDPRMFRRDSHDRRDGTDHSDWSEISAQMLVEIEGFSKNLEGRSEA